MVGVDFGGFDTHGKQTPTHDTLMEYLAQGLGRIWEEANSNVLTLVVSEFGRTARANDGEGTDHGVGGLYVAMGAAGQSMVRGGTYNCYNPLAITQGLREYGKVWPNLNDDNPAKPQFDNACEVKTDFRAVIGEILDKHFQFPTAAAGPIASILPGYDHNQTGQASELEPLDFLN